MRLLPVCTALALSVTVPSLALAQLPVAATAPEELSEDEKIEKAKKLYVQAEQLAAEDNWEAAVVLYEQAYYLVPGKHGFAHKVGVAAWRVHNCDKAYEYMTHFVEYADPERQGDKIAEAKDILAQIEAENCRTPEPEPEPEPVIEEAENPLETGETGPDPETKDKKKKGPGKPLLVGGAVMVALGVVGFALGGAGAGMASGAGATLDQLASTSTMTGFPIGDYECRDDTADCPTKLESRLSAGKALSYVGFIGGGLLLVGGAALIAMHVTKSKAKTESASARAKPRARLTGLGPALLPGGGGAMASLRF